MAREYNFIYTELVKGKDDILGHIAYSLYKAEKIEFIESFKKGNNREPNENELNNISNNLNTLSESIIFDDELLEKDFINVFNIIKEQFKNYVFEHYNNDLEKIITSPYLFEQISNDKLNFTRTKFWGGLADEIIQLQYGDAINVTTRKKAYVTNGRGDIRQAGQSFEPQWQFASTSTKCDTINLINATIIQEILSKKYNIKFI